MQAGAGIDPKPALPPVQVLGAMAGVGIAGEAVGDTLDVPID